MSALYSLLTNTLGMTLLAALFLGLRVALQRFVKPIACYAMGIIIAAGLLIPLRPVLPVPLMRVPPSALRLPAQSLQTPDTVPYDYDFLAEEYQEKVLEAQLSGMPVAEPYMPPSTPIWEILIKIAGLVWLCGAAGMAAYHTVRHIRFRSLLRRWKGRPDKRHTHILAGACTAMGIRTPPRLWRCGAVQSPMLAGLFHPVILLPESTFSDEELEIVLRHELVHYKRHDLWYKAAVLAMVCAYWWNPFAWLVARAISADCEMSCDDAVLAGASLAQRKVYGETILSAVTQRKTPHPILSTYFYERKKDMKRRFSSMLNMHPRKVGGLLVILCLGLTLLTGSVFATDAAAPATGGQETVSPTTGLPYPEGRDGAYRPVLVEISNTGDARPQLGLSLADIIYEYIFWGPGHTRYLALFNDYHPEMAGPVRSSKTLGMSLRNSWDCPIVFAGGPNHDPATDLYQFIAAHNIPGAMLFDGEPPDERALADRAQAVFARVAEREFPNNAVVNLRELAGAQWPTDGEGMPYTPAAQALVFTQSPGGSGPAATEIIIPYDEQDYLPRFAYNAQAGRYERWYNGTPQMDALTGRQVTADNVIVLYANLSYSGGSMSDPLWSLTGGGALDVFTGGSHRTGRWRREDDDAGLALLDEGGNPLQLAPGNTFVQIVPEDMEIYY